MTPELTLPCSRWTHLNPGISRTSASLARPSPTILMLVPSDAVAMLLCTSSPCQASPNLDKPTQQAAETTTVMPTRVAVSTAGKWIRMRVTSTQSQPPHTSVIAQLANTSGTATEVVAVRMLGMLTIRVCAQTAAARSTLPSHTPTLPLMWTTTVSSQEFTTSLPKTAMSSNSMPVMMETILTKCPRLFKTVWSWVSHSGAQTLVPCLGSIRWQAAKVTVTKTPIRCTLATSRSPTKTTWISLMRKKCSSFQLSND